MDQLLKILVDTPPELRLQILQAAAPVLQEQEKTKQEEAKVKQLDREIEKRRIEAQIEAGKQLRICGDHVTMSSEHLASMLDGRNYYSTFVAINLREFNIQHLLKNNNNVNDDMVKIFENYFDRSKVEDDATESVIQNAIDYLLKKLFVTFDDFTSLKYLNTSRFNYLNSNTYNKLDMKNPDVPNGKAPDCTFIYKNINIRIKDGDNCLQDFVVCLGELKRPEECINEDKYVGQLCYYLDSVLQVQNRTKVYGFITNLREIRFYYALKDNTKNSPVMTFYRSETLQIFNKPSTSTPPAKKKKKLNQQSKQSDLNKNTIETFIKFLMMDFSFYEYKRLNIKPNDYLYQDEYRIKQRLGSGATSMAYLLVNKDYHESDNHYIFHVIKISRTHDNEKHFKNEIEIYKQLKTIDSNNFNKFFSNIIASSPESKFIIFENFLTSLQPITIMKAQQIIDIIQYLYKLNILHRDVRPDNLMYDKRNNHVKLIDFGFARLFETNENKIELPIAGTTLFGSIEFLEKYLQILELNQILQTYEYDRYFDLKCAINTI
ncbi:unnamed protein product, partial [Rotaria sp. Silwood2]